MKNSNTNPKLAFSGMMTAVSAVLALMMNFLPFNTIFLLIIMSLLICVVTQKAGVVYALCTAAATSLIMLLLTWQYAAVAEYVLMFGTYPVIKYIIESKINNVKTERTVKTLYFAFASVLFMLAAVYLFGGAEFWGEWFSKSVVIPYLLIVVMVLAAWVFDIVLTQIIYVYNRMFGRRF